MFAISTIADTSTLPQPMQEYLYQRITALHNNYCSNGSPPLGQFSLSSVGEIMLAHSYEEICNITFEEVQKKTIGGDVYYICRWVRDNERCCEVYLCKNLLTPEEINLLNEECYLC